jgi:hypothetical protein
VRLRIEHPHLANLSCEDCKKWVYDLTTGKPQLYGGKLVAQHRTGPPCVQEPGICPKGSPGESDLTRQNERVVRHFEQCRATGDFPDDGHVHRHAAILEPLFRQAERRRQTSELTISLAKILVRSKR